MLANEHNNTVEVGMHRALTPSRSRSPAWSDDDNAMQRAIDSQPQYRAPVPTMGNLGQGLSEDEQGAIVEVFNLFAGDELQENIHQAAAYAVGALSQRHAPRLHHCLVEQLGWIRQRRGVSA